MSNDPPLDPEAGASPERRLIDAAFKQELGSSVDPGRPPPVFGQAGSLLTSPEDIPGYEIIREIHRGGQGVVYQAIQKTTKRAVAIKVMREGPFAGPADKARFEREIQILAALNHPNIVTIHDSGEARGSFYYVMTYVPGEPLDVYLSHSTRTPEDGLRLFAKICEAVNSAHLQGVIHRDLKPGNIRVDPNGEPHILDFGLARRTPDLTSGESAPPAMTLTGQFVGSLPWASPEQAEGVPGKVDIRTDVYSLGVILYQMLTGRFPYAVIGNMRDVLDNILKAEPAKPSTIRRQLNDEVETIVLKCLSKERERRYQSAGELSRDIDRYLKGEPIEAKRDSPLYMLKKSLRQYRTPLVLGVTFVLFIFASVLLFANSQKKLAEQREHASQRESRIQKVNAECSDPRLVEWSKRAWKVAGTIATDQPDDAARHSAVITLSGLDAHVIRHFSKSNTSALAFDQTGEQLLLGGATPPGHTEKQTAQLWEGRSDRLSPSTLQGEGPVAFRADGTPLQLVAQKDALMLWNVATQTEVQKLRFPGEVARTAEGEPDTPSMALSPDGSTVAASMRLLQRDRRAETPDDAEGIRDFIIVWDSSSGKILRHLPGKASALSFTPDGNLLAAGDSEGRIRVFPLKQDGREAELPAIQAGIKGLAFQRDPTVSGKPKPETATAGWLLAAGDSSGSVVVWDLTIRLPKTYFHGSPYAVYTVDLSPDGTLLASAGRQEARLWDVATGQLLLRLEPCEHATAVRFSPDGSKLAVGAQADLPNQVSVWELEDGRGIQALRGLAAQVSLLCFSRDDGLLAGLSHEWKVAIWDLKQRGRLRYLLDAPKGLFADNATLSFSPDGHQLALSTWKRGQLWDIDSGRLLLEWPLREGLCDVLAFTSNDELLSFRMETENDEQGPTSDAPWRKHPRVCRIRRLRRGDPSPTVVKVIKDFNEQVYAASGAPDGSYFVADGRGSVAGGGRMVKFYGSIGEELYSLPSTRTIPGGSFTIDPTGQFLGFQLDDAQWTLFQMPAHRLVARRDGWPCCLSPRAELWASGTPSPPDDSGIVIYGTKADRLLVTLGTNFKSSVMRMRYSNDGSLLAWGTMDGSVYLCNPKEVQNQLAKLGLDWRE